jgi:hypothetical protein
MTRSAWRRSIARSVSRGETRSRPQRLPSAVAWQAFLALCSAAVSTSCGSDAAPSTLEAGSSLDGSGGSNGGSSTNDGAKPDALNCPPTITDRWVPSWKAPRSPASPCTMEQIQAIYDICDYGSPNYDDAACRDYGADRRNTACLLCIYSVEGDPNSGPIILMSDGSVWSNVGGCIALVDGDMTAGSCGAKVSAAAQCRDAACMSCVANEYVDCTVAAVRTVCSAYSQVAVCSRQPAYAVCYHPTWIESFYALSAMFCSAGIDAGSTSDSGAEAGLDAGQGLPPSSD